MQDPLGSKSDQGSLNKTFNLSWNTQMLDNNNGDNNHSDNNMNAKKPKLNVESQISGSPKSSEINSKMDEIKKRIEQGYLLIKEVKQVYEQKDDNVYKVNVTTTSEDVKISRMKMVQILMKLNVKNVFDIKSIAKNKLCIYFNNLDTANKFSVTDLTVYNLKAEIPLHYVNVVGVLKGIPLDMSMNELHGIIKEQDRVVKLERILRKERVESDKGQEFILIPTSCVKITFNLTILPRDIDLTYYKEKVHAFVSATRQCQKCFRFGHTKYQCKSASRCDRCGGDHTSNLCTAKKIECLHCKGEHLASSLACPERERQKNIKSIMAKKNISYREALFDYPQFTKNQFDILNNFDEDFPNLTRDNYSHVVKRNPNIRSRTQSPNKRAKIIVREKQTPIKVTYEDRNKFNRMRENLAYTDNTFEPLHKNPHKTSEFERFAHSIQQNVNRQDFIQSQQFPGTSSFEQSLIAVNNEQNDNNEVDMTDNENNDL
jgi:hypothetical protein